MTKGGCLVYLPPNRKEYKARLSWTQIHAHFLKTLICISDRFRLHTKKLEKCGCRTDYVHDLLHVPDTVDDNMKTLATGGAVATIHDLYVSRVGVHHQFYVTDNTLESAARDGLKV